jgi:hypothetical protein
VVRELEPRLETSELKEEHMTISARIAALLEKTRATRGRLISAIDATQSRQPTWDVAASLQTTMFEEAARIGGLEVQLVHFGGNECFNTPWTADTGELAKRMRMIQCEAGNTQILRVLEHIREEHARNKVAAAIFIGDAAEEVPQQLYDAAAGLGVPIFLFQGGHGLAIYVDQHGEIVRSHAVQTVEEIFRQLAQLTGGAYAQFDATAASKLGELLRAAAAFAVGGAKALADLRNETARKLLTQMRGAT